MTTTMKGRTTRRRPSSSLAAAATGPPRLLLILFFFVVLFVVSLPPSSPIGVDSDDDVVDASTSTAEDDDDDEEEKEEELLLLLLEKRRAELRNVRSEFDRALLVAGRIDDFVGRRIDGHRRNSRHHVDVDGRTLRGIIDAASDMASDLANRTADVMARVAELNRAALSGEDDDDDDEYDAGGGGRKRPWRMGLGRRLTDASAEESNRRDRLLSAAALVVEATKASSAPRYATLAELDDLLSSSKVVATTPARPSRDDDDNDNENDDDKRRSELTSISGEIEADVVVREEDMLKERARRSYELYGDYGGGEEGREEENDTTSTAAGVGRRRQTTTTAAAAAACLDVPDAIEIVGRALTMRYRDGGIDAFDHAKRENGGSVVYGLTSTPYVPPPRIIIIAAEEEEEEEGRRRRRTFDDEAEEAHHRGYNDRRRMLLLDDGEGGVSSTFDRLLEAIRETDVWGWYTSFEFGRLRPYLPEDWERALDVILPSSWSRYTPRATIDALVPDYVYHAFGVSSTAGYGTLFGRTAHPDVAISSGGYAYRHDDYDHDDDVGDDGGWTAKPVGHCYPLSMRPEDDPAPSFLGGGIGAGRRPSSSHYDDLPSLVGPKYTVLLPYPILIDAVSLEHRSFPVSRRDSERGRRGGESAPRWFCVVGFPPCPERTDDGGDDDDECAARGFDVDGSIDLGSFEYRRITVTGREDDYGGGDDDSINGDEKGGENDTPFPGGRRRSIQTFAVKGGRWEPPSLLVDDGASSDDDIAIEVVEENTPMMIVDAVAPGQCAPPKDEDSPPSCGGDATDNSASKASSYGGGGGGGDRRKIVAAVSFIVEENWGEAEYTCLYRVRVHGAAVVG